MLTGLMTSVLKCSPIVILWVGLETRAMSEHWREKFPCMATQTAHLKMSAPNYRAVSAANPLTLFAVSSQTSVETPVKNAFSAADGVEQPIPAIPGRLVLCTACNPATAPLPPHPRHLHNLHRQRDGDCREGKLGGGGYRKLTSNCIWPCGETNMAVWVEPMPQRALMTTRWDAPTNMLIDGGKGPTPPPHLRSQVQYRHNRNKAESLSTLEVHWSTTVACLFINQLSFANCLLRWTAQVCVAHCCISLKTEKLFDIIQLKMDNMLR